jgi:D-glycerate 3-kinase
MTFSMARRVRPLSAHLEGLARRGPAFAALEAAGAVNWSRWPQAASFLERVLPAQPRRDERIHWLIIPVLQWLAHAAYQSPHRALLAGLSAPQGAGKSTLVQQLVPLLEQQGLRAVAVSIDDFYLRREEQLRLAGQYSEDRLLQHRGYPGTHDLGLGLSTLEALRSGGEAVLPRYDKSAHGGRGDRSAEVTRVQGPFDVVLVDGWMLGFSPVASPPPALARVNHFLGPYEAWHRELDVMVALRAEDPRLVVPWRVEAERALRAAGKRALDDAAITDYAERFVPAYETWGATVTKGRWAPDRQLALTLGADRLPR